MPQTQPNGVIVPINSDAYNTTGDLATMADSINAIIPVANKAARDALTLKTGLTVQRLDTPDLRIEKYSGSAWYTPNGTAYTPTWSSPGSLGTGGNITGMYWVNGDKVELRASVTAGTGTTLPAGVVGFNLPSAFPMAAGLNNVGQCLYRSASGGLRTLIAICAPGSTVSIWVPQNNADALNPGAAGLPWGSGYSFEALITYQTTTVL
jgi:hypothetical protein